MVSALPVRDVVPCVSGGRLAALARSCRCSRMASAPVIDGRPLSEPRLLIRECRRCNSEHDVAELVRTLQRARLVVPSA